MKRDWSFPKQVFFALIIGLIVSWYPLVTYASQEIIMAVIAGTAIMTLNVLFGYAAIAYSLDKSMTTFFKYVLGGMGLRMAGMILCFFVLVSVLHVHSSGLLASMGVWYIVFLTMEILFIQKKVSFRQQH